MHNIIYLNQVPIIKVKVTPGVGRGGVVLRVKSEVFFILGHTMSFEPEEGFQ